MKKVSLGALSALMTVVLAAPAVAHVTVQPNEAVVGSFSRFVVRVPNERDDASTIRVEVQLPPLAFVSFEPKDGWRRDTEEVTLDDPIEAFGQEITETVGSVTWSGGEIGPGEFEEFGFSARMPDEETTLEFRAIQEYDSGEVVEWTGAPDSEQPAAHLAVLDIGAEEDEGQLAVLARLNSEVAAGDTNEGDTGAAEDDDATASDGDISAGDNDDAGEMVPLIVSIVAALLAAAALVVALRRPSAHNA